MATDYLKVYEQGIAKIKYLKNHLVDFPHITRNGEWLQHKNGHWTGGFWTGLLWLNSLQSTKLEDFEVAREWALRFQTRIHDNKTHDQGFIYGPSCVMGYNIINEGAFIPLIHAGANNLVDLYNPEVGLVLAWDEPDYEGIAIVDTIMNLPLLWISDTLKGQTSKKDLMKTVVEKVLEYHIKDDFSTFHVAKWEQDCKVLPATHQGDSVFSCWSRGQAWALYGFANVSRYTNDRAYLDVAIKLAEYFYRNLNANLLPAWDFLYRDDPNYPIDAAAASIASSGMLLIAFLLKLDGNRQASNIWKERAVQILEAETENCLYKDLEHYGIIEKVTVDYPRQSGIGESSMYGDYYFMEALYRLQSIDNLHKTFLLY